MEGWIYFLAAVVIVVLVIAVINIKIVPQASAFVMETARCLLYDVGRRIAF